MSLAPYIHAMGRGPSRARSLTQEEAADAMAQILKGTAAPEAVGALLMLMRYRGETAAEVAGFTQAARANLKAWACVGAGLDWPCYAAGRSRGLPWFLLAAKLVAQAGHPVLLHGWNSHQNPVADVRAGVRALGIPCTNTPECATAALARAGIAYAPLEAVEPRLLAQLRLRDVLGLRSAVNTVCRMVNPSDAPAMVQGVFHPSYRALQQDAGALLGQSNLLVLKGGGGEFERNPAKTVQLYGLAKGRPVEIPAPPLHEEHRRLADTTNDSAHLPALWHGTVQDPWAEAIVIGTAAAALLALDPSKTLVQTTRQANSLWRARHGLVAA